MTSKQYSWQEFWTDSLLIITNCICAPLMVLRQCTSLYPETRIIFELDQDAAVKLEIYNMKGQKISTLVNENLKAGYHSTTWFGIDDKGNKVSSGVYLYRLTTTNGDYLTKKMILLK